MTQRPIIGGAVAVGIVAAALRLTVPGPPSQGPSFDGSAAVGKHGKHVVVPKISPFDQVSWTDEMKNHPEELGRFSAQKELDQTIDDFYSPPPGSGGNTPATLMNPGTISPEKIQVMIVIEPDPVHTHLSLWFDRDMDALEDALQDSGWQYQSSWLPWFPLAAPTTGDHFVDRQQEGLFLEGREEFPGVLLFRPGAGENCVKQKGDTSAQDKVIEEDITCHPLAVFVVGNSPTAGIDRTQFLAALARLKMLSPDQTELRIVGPSFTGSCKSLRDLLSTDEVKDSGLKQITVASGSVSDPYCYDSESGRNSQKRQIANQTAPAVSYVSFGPDKDWRTQQTVEFLKGRGQFSDEEIAELSEGESGYGSWFSSEAPSCSPPSIPVTSRRKEKIPKPCRSGDFASQISTGPLRLHFPRNISHLRSAYQKSNIFGFGSTTQGATTSLNLDFEEAKDDDDAIPNFAPQQMPVSQDGIMHQIADLFERRHIKVVIVTATDVLDELFVAQILAREAPNTLVIVNQADDLFLRSGSGANFENMYFVSPWPLIADSQFWSRRLGEKASSSTHTFPSDLSEGLHAAVRYLVTPGHLPELPNYGSPLTYTDRPPLWLSAVGHGEYWPIALLNNPHPNTTYSQSQQRSKVNLPPLPQKYQPAGIFQTELSPISKQILLLVLGMFAVYHTLKCLQIPALHDLSYRYVINDAGARTPKLSLQLSMTLLLLLSLQLSYTPSDPSRFAHLIFVVSTAALCVALAYLIQQIALTFFSSLNSSEQRSFIANVLLIALLSCMSFYVAITFWQYMWDALSSSSGFPAFFQYRSSYPLRSISPIFPLFLTTAAFFALFYNHLDRIAFTRDLAPRLPDTVEGLTNCPSDGQLKPVTRLLAWPPDKAIVLQKSLWLSTIFIVALILIQPLQLKPRTFDGTYSQRVLCFSMFLIVVAIFWELFMASTLWLKLKSLCLERLESSSLRRGFSTVRGLTWKSFWIIQENRSARYRAITRLLEQASRHVMEEEASSPLQNLSFSEASGNLLHEFRRQPHDPQKVVSAFGVLQERIAYVAHLLLIKLRVAWHGEKRLITAPDAIETEEKPASSPADEAIDPSQELREEWVALVYIHYIRMVLLQMRSRLLTAAALYLFLIWACTSYPYLNRHVLLIALSVLLGVLAFTIISIYASVNRDAILSRSTNHTPGHLDLDFYFKVASFVGIPLVAFVASQFPEVSSFLFSWIEPGMAVAK
ncbi:MAG TPA: hypothetical protein VNU92_07770 [Edaphobacter sp.]|jgi:hypothetical protein|nr:hypothetical protein [Edaphobacter sp.]